MASKQRRKKEVFVHGKEFNPTEPRGRLSLAYRGLKDLPTETFAHPRLVKILDLSHNDLVDFRFLQVLTELNTLVIDNNKATSHSSFPRLSNLQVLWINQNQISNLPLFISNIVSNFPSLTQLSMMKNEAAPSYFNGGSKKDYDEYRYYVITHIPNLVCLDDQSITGSEREEAFKMFGPRMRTSSIAGQRNGNNRKSRKVHKKPSEATPLLAEDAM